MKKAISCISALLMALSCGLINNGINVVAESSIDSYTSESQNEEGLIDLSKYETYPEVSQSIINAMYDEYQNYGLGCVIDDNDDFSGLYEEIPDAPLRDISLPSSYDLSDDTYFPPVGSQGQIASCSSWATTYYQFTYQANRLNNISTTAQNAFSPRWTYNWLNKGQSIGTGIPENYSIIYEQGALTLADAPYNSTNYDFSWNYSTQSMIDALRTRIVNNQRTHINTSVNKILSPSDSRLDSIKQKIVGGQPVAVGVESINGLSNLSMKSIVYGGQSGDLAVYACSSASNGHAMTIVGYDDNVWCDINNDGYIENAEKGAFKLVNSYGSTWGNSGFIWVMYDALNGVSAVSNAPIISNRIHIFGSSNGTRNNFYSINVANYPVNVVSLLEVTTDNRYGFSLGSAITPNSSLYSFNHIIDCLQTGLNQPFNGVIVLPYYDSDNILNHTSDYWWTVAYTGITYHDNTAISYEITDNKMNVIKNWKNLTTHLSSSAEVSDGQQILFSMGDLNYDGQITTEDALIIMSADAGLTELSDLQLELGDMNGNGVVNLNDAVAILQIVG